MVLCKLQKYNMTILSTCCVVRKNKNINFVSISTEKSLINKMFSIWTHNWIRKLHMCSFSVYRDILVYNLYPCFTGTCKNSKVFNFSQRFMYFKSIYFNIHSFRLILMALTHYFICVYYTSIDHFNIITECIWNDP